MIQAAGTPAITPLVASLAHSSRHSGSEATSALRIASEDWVRGLTAAAAFAPPLWGSLRGIAYGDLEARSHA